MFRLLARSSLSLNQDGFSQRAVNMRHFEATGMGSVLVTEHKDDLGELFDTEREVVTYRTPEECVEKVRYLLSHESERAAIAAAGQARTLRDHRLEDRAKSLANDLEERLRAL
jgi:spore maturation protein CgeB